MTVIQLNFLAGRYHATSWGRHVNEGQPEWPPSPFRLLRALVDAWKRRHPDWPSGRVEDMLAALSAPPQFCLPPVAFAHTRSYLPTNKPDVSDRKLVFDGFAVVHPDHPVLLGWPSVNLGLDTRSFLSELLDGLNYLGRSESWVKASLLHSAAAEGVRWNCEPQSHAEGDFPVRRVACALSPELFAASKQRVQIVEKHPASAESDPGSIWLRSLALSSGEVMRGKLSDPPSMVWQDYAMIEEPSLPESDDSQKDPVGEINAVLFALDSKVLPLITGSIEITERVRTKLMGIHKRIVGFDKVSPRFSGKSQSGVPLKGHRHSFIHALDQDGDGRIDHLLLTCSEPYTASELESIDRLNSLWQANGKPDIQCVPTRLGKREEVLTISSEFISATPFIPTRHHRRGRGEFVEWLRTEFRRACAEAGLPSPDEVEPLQHLELLRGRRIHWLDFRRSRKGDAPKQGYGFRLRFSSPVAGPFSVGYGAHFGLGLFVPLPLGKA